MGSDEAAIRHADQMRLRPGQRVEDGANVGDMGVEAVVFSPVAVAVPSQIERDRANLGAQSEADIVPGLRRQPPAMQEKRRRSVATPVEGLQPVAATA